MDCSPPGSSDHGIIQARILELVAIPFSRGSSQPRIKPGSPALKEDSLPSELPGKPVATILVKAIMISDNLQLFINSKLLENGANETRGKGE